MDSLTRFIEAQKTDYQTALREIRNGRKRSHWIWYIFPQIQGLGFSETSRYYCIKNMDEAAAYLKHPMLGSRLTEISGALLNLKTHNATQVLGSPDDLKLKSSMTLFAAIPGANTVFNAVLEKYFGGEKDQKTLDILNR